MEVALKIAYINLFTPIMSGFDGIELYGNTSFIICQYKYRKKLKCIYYILYLVYKFMKNS